MTQRAAFKAAFLEKLGAPLLASIPVSEDGQSEAQQMAALLGQSVSLGAKLSDMLELKESDEKAESIRIGLTATASGLLAAYQQKTGKAPDEAMTRRMLGALETSLTFADNFTAAGDNTVRLELMDAEGMAVDENQLNIQYMRAFLPIVAAVADFTFGRDEKQLVIEVADKLSTHAEALAADMMEEDAGKAEKKRIELMILRTLVQLYEGCHQAEMQKLVKMDEQERMKLSEESGGQLSMEGVWQAFSLRVAMLKSIAGLDKVSQTDQEQGAAFPEEAAAPKEQPPEPQALTAPPQVPVDQSVEQPQEQQQAEAAEPQQQAPAGENANPMSFFAKKPASGNTGDNNNNNESQEA